MRALSDDLAWRVVWRLWWDLEEDFVPTWLAEHVGDARVGLNVSVKYVRAVWTRYWTTGNVAT